MLKHLKVFPLQIIISNRLPGHCSSWPVAAFYCVRLLSPITGQGTCTVLVSFESSTNVWLWWNLHPVWRWHGLMSMHLAGFLNYLTENVQLLLTSITHHKPPKYKELTGCCMSKGTVKRSHLHIHSEELSLGLCRGLGVYEGSLYFFSWRLLPETWKLPAYQAGACHVSSTALASEPIFLSTSAKCGPYQLTLHQ